jgi:hypothetical protein
MKYQYSMNNSGQKYRHQANVSRWSFVKFHKLRTLAFRAGLKARTWLSSFATFSAMFAQSGLYLEGRKEGRDEKKDRTGQDEGRTEVTERRREGKKG